MRIKYKAIISLIMMYLIIINSRQLYAQTESWIEPWQKSTISFGLKESISITLSNNKTVKKDIFNIKGTGAIFYVKVDTIVIPTIVTAKHVFYNPNENWSPDSLRIRFSWFEDKPIDEYFGIPIILNNNAKRAWFPHPDSTVDLACISLDFIQDDIGVEKLPILPYSQFANDDDIYQGAQIFVLGYPGSVGMEFWNKAVLREGIISWVAPNEPQKHRILIDCSVFPGNSGGPVFKIPTGIDKFGNLTVGGKYKFLGIVSERRFSPIPVKETRHHRDIVDDTGSYLYSLESIGIGVIEPALRVRELLNAFKNCIKDEIDQR